MSSFPTPPFSIADESTAARLDRAVAQSRQAAIPSEVSQRTRPRASVKELNELDLEEIKARMRRTSFDTRGPVTRFLDLLDVPRNTVASTLFPAIKARKEAEGETGTFGRGTVRFSDILGELGMRPGIARGVIGFVGDVVTDPLTYAGPGAAKTLASAGRNLAVKIGKSGDRAFKGAIKAVGRGQEIDNPIVRNLADNLVRVKAVDRLNKSRAAKGMAPLSAAERAAYLSKRLYGSVTSGAKPLKAEPITGGSAVAANYNKPTLAALEGEALEAVTLPGATAKGDLIHRVQDAAGNWVPTGRTSKAKGLENFRAKLDARTAAAKAATAEYGIAAKQGAGKAGFFTRAGQALPIPSLRIGDGGSQIAHIPFTDIGIYAPSFTANARQAAAVRAAALAADGAPKLGGLLRDAYDATHANLGALRQMETAESARSDAVLNGDGFGANAAREMRDAAVEQARTTAARLREQAGQLGDYPELSIGDIQYHRQMADTAEAAAGLAEARLKAMPYFQQIAENMKGSPSSAGGISRTITGGRNTMAASADAAAFPHRNRVSREMVAAFGPESDNIIPVVDAYARGWAQARGVHPDEYYQGLRVQKGGKPGEGAMFSTMAWHGSPHKFDKFDISKVGTGEGAQVYGHGLYFAGSEDVAKWYREKLSGANPSTFSKDGVTLTPETARAEYFKPGRIVNGWNGRDRVLEYRPSGDGSGWKVKVQSINRDGTDVYGERPRWHYTQPDEVEMRSVLASEGFKEDPKGRLFKVELAPDENLYLDWDKPLSQQSPEVIAALEKMHGGEQYGGFHPFDRGSSVYKSISEARGEPNSSVVQWGPDRNSPNDAAASKALKEAGIPGIKYLDGASRNKGKGTHNYVLFDDKDVAIKEMFQRGAEGTAQGSHEIAASGQRIIRALTNPDASTLPHEVAHDFLHNLTGMDAGLAERAAKALGAESHAALTVDQHEQFARAFESYLRDGKAPSLDLKAVFEKFKDWLVDLYKSIVGTPLEGKLNPQLKSVFDDMLTAGEHAKFKSPAERFADNQLAVLDMHDADIGAAAARADALHSYMESAWRLADRTRGSIMQHLDPRVADLAENAKIALGLGPDAMGTSLFTPYRTVAQSVSGDGNIPLQADVEAAERMGRDIFGNKRAGINRFRARYASRMRGGAQEEADLANRAINQKFASLAKAKGWTGAQQDAAHRLMMAKAYMGQPGVGDAIWLTTVDGKPSALVRALDDAKSLGVAADTDAAKGIDDLASEIVAMFGEMGDQGVALGAMKGSQNKAFYVPKRLDPAVAKQIAAREPVNAKAPGGVTAETFSQPSQTTQYRFKSADGTVKQFLEADRWVAGLTDEQMKAMEWPAEYRAEQAKIRDTVAEFDALYADVDPALRPQLLGRATDPFELNELYQKGYFNYLTGNTPQGERLFSDNLMYTMRERSAEQSRAIARSAFERAFDKYAIRVADKVEQREGMEPGAFVFSNGITGHALGRDTFRIGDTVYRKLKDVSSISESLMDGILDSRNLAKFYPEKVAEQIERAVNWSADAGNKNAFLGAVDKLTRLWKGITLTRPAWITFNVVGNMWQMMMGGVKPQAAAKMMKPALEMMWLGKNPEQLLKKTVNVRGVPVTLDEIRMDAIQHGILDSGFGSENMAHLFPDGAIKPMQFTPEGATLRERLEAKGKMFNEAYQRALNTSMRARAVDSAKTPLDKIRAASHAARDEGYTRKLMAPLAAANGVVENWMRLTAYMSFLDDGMDATTAAAKVKETLFDFTDMTRAETNVRKYAIPFYSWIRNNGAYQLRTFLSDPKWAALYPKLKEAVEESVAGEMQLPEHMRPTWMREQMTTQLTSDPESRASFTAGNVIPTEPVLHAGAALTGGWKGIGDAAKFLGSSINPLVGIPLQVGAGREYYSDREIGADETEGDITTPEFLYNQISGPFKEVVGPGVRTPPLISAFQRGPVEGALRLVAGGRVQPMDDQRVRFQNVRELKDREERIRKAIAVAEREGDAEASQRARTVLLQLWKRAIEMGLGDTVPKYGREQLGIEDAELQPSGV